MPNVVAQAVVIAFLLRIKTAISSGSWVFVPRKETRDTLTRFGWLPKHLAGVVTGLVVADYFNGPVPDLNPSFGGDVWEFGPIVSTNEGDLPFYVKLKVASVSGLDQVTILSFHPAKSPIVYPFSTT